MRRFLAAAYGGAAYLAFLLPIGYLAGFLADAGVPKTVDRGAGPVGPSLAVDLGLLLMFGLQHSVMARPGFKRRIRHVVPPSMERSTYVLASGLALAAVFWLWRPLPAVLWDVSGTPLESAAWAAYAAGWALAVWATFALSHLHLFGVAQVAAYVRGREHPRLALRDTLLYRIVRHPMTAGLVLAFWSTPCMTLGHLVFALGMTAYSLAATVLEERDLLRAFPDAYRTYRRRVPALVPFLRPGLLAPRRGGLGFELGLLGAAALAGAALLLHASAVPGAATEPGPVPERVVVPTDAGSRTFELFDPAEPGGPPRPAVLALHGTGGDAARLRAFLGGELERRARERGWVVVYPEAFRGAWNDCRLRATSAARRSGVDDVGFLRAVVDRLAGEGRVDPARVFALGYSGGAHMAFRVALESPALVRGVAAFGASLPVEEELACRVDRSGAAVSLLLVNGTDDRVSPFRGGDVITPTGVPLGRVRSAPETARYFRERAGHDVEVREVTVEGGGHTVPGPASRFPGAAGTTDRSVDGIGEALAFFARQIDRPEEEP